MLVATKLVGIPRADGGNTVGQPKGARSQVDRAPVHHERCVHRMDIEDVREDRGVILPLVFDVMHGIDGAHGGKAYLGGKHRAEINDRQRTLPVVGMQNIGEARERAQVFNNGTGKEGKALAVIVFPVKRRAVEILWIRNKKIGDPIILQEVHLIGDAPPGKIKFALVNLFHTAAVSLIDRAIEREQHPHLPLTAP